MVTPYLRAETLDDLMRDVFETLHAHGRPVTASRGSSTELTGFLLELTNARARLSRTESKGTPFSALGEFCWYLSGRGDYAFIEYYLKSAYDPNQDVEPDGNISGAYGPRLIGPREDDQLERVVALLQRRPTTRQAVLRLFDASDLRTGQHDVPCTCTIQFLNRDGRLEVITYMRSNDAYLGLPHDVFCFTLLQEWVARRLRLELGAYKHAVGSLHLYDDDSVRVQRYLEEGFQSTLSPMPPMPTHDPEAGLAGLLGAEEALRMSPPDFARAITQESMLDGYWADLVRLLRAYRHSSDGDPEAIFRVRDSMISPIYYQFLDRKGRNAADRSAR